MQIGDVTWLIGGENVQTPHLHANKVVAEHFPELPVEAIDWETSTRMQRSAGIAIYDYQSEQITIRLS